MELKRYLVHQQGQYYDNLKRDLFKQSAMWNSLIRKISMSTQSLAINVAIKHKNFSTQLNLLEQSLEDIDEQLLSKITMIETKVIDLANEFMNHAGRRTITNTVLLNNLNTTKHQLISELKEINNENSVSGRILIAAINRTYDEIDEIGGVSNTSNEMLYQNLTKQLKQMEIRMIDTVENLNETISQLLADVLLEFKPSAEKGTVFKWKHIQ